MSALFLVGLHGSGKTTAGRLLAARGYAHYSVGDLARLARNSRVPAGIPVRLMVELARHRPGQPLQGPAVDALLRFVSRGDHGSKRGVALDGFPSSPDHVPLLPHGCAIIEMVARGDTRASRLHARSEATRRKWDSGRTSARDLALNAVLEQARARSLPVVSVHNDGSLENLRDRLEAALASLQEAYA